MKTATDPFKLYEELQILKSTSLENINDAKQLIQYILENNFQEIYPNLYSKKYLIRN